MDSEANLKANVGGSKRKNTKRHEHHIDKKIKRESDIHNKHNHVLSLSTYHPEDSQGGSIDSVDEYSFVNSPNSPKSKCKNKLNRKCSSPFLLEDIIDGFAISSFRTLDDLEDHSWKELQNYKIKTHGYSLSAIATTAQENEISSSNTTITTLAGGTTVTTIVSAPIPGHGLPVIVDTQVKVPMNIPLCNKTNKPLATPSAIPNSDGDHSPVGLSNTPLLRTIKKEKLDLDEVLDKLPSREPISSVINNSSRKEIQTSHTTFSCKSTSTHGNSNLDSSQRVNINYMLSCKQLDSSPDIQVVQESKTIPDSCASLAQSDQTIGRTDVGVKKEIESSPEEHNHSQGNHKIKGLSPVSRIKQSNKYTKDNLLNGDRPSHLKHNLQIQLCNDYKMNEDRTTKVLVRSHEIIVEEPLSQNGGQSVLSLSVSSSVVSDRSNSREHNREYDNENDIDVPSKASDSMSESMHTANSVIKRESGMFPPPFHNGALHPMATVNPSSGSNHSSHNSHHAHQSHHSSSIKLPAATTASLTAVTTTTTSARPPVVPSTTVVTSTIASATSTTTNAPLNSIAKFHSLVPPSPPSPTNHSSRSHSSVHREQPRPIPGLSGTRPEDRENHRDRDHEHRVPTPQRPYSRGHSWHGPGLSSSHSTPHISPASSLPVSGLHHSASLASLHHSVHPHQHTPPTGRPGLPPTHSVFMPQLRSSPSLTSSALKAHPLAVQSLTSSLNMNHELNRRTPHDPFLPDRFGIQNSFLPTPFLSSFHPHHAAAPGLPLSLTFSGRPYALSESSLLHPPSHSSSQLNPAGSLIRPPPGLPELDRERRMLDNFSKMEAQLSYRPASGLPGASSLRAMGCPSGLPGASSLGAMGGISGLPGPEPLALSSMLHPSPGLLSAAPPPPIGSRLPGAFQSMRTNQSTPYSSLLPLPREREKSQSPSVNPVRKSGKWCAAHVHVAWEIKMQQQKQAKHQQAAQHNSESKPTDLLRPPSHHHLPPPHTPGTASIHRVHTSHPYPAEVGPSSLLGGGVHGPHRYSPYDAPPRPNPYDAPPRPNPYDAPPRPSHTATSLFGASHLGAAQPFPHHSLYPGLPAVPPLNPTAFGGLGSMGNLGAGLYGREPVPVITGLAPPHEWNRLHRTPPSFPTAVTPPKPELDRDRDKDHQD